MRGRTGGQPEEEAIRSGVDARAVRQDGGHVDHHIQRVAELVKVGQQPDGRVGDDDADLGEAAEEAVWRMRASARPSATRPRWPGAMKRVNLLRSSERQALQPPST
jgi:hypothetical protein